MNDADKYSHEILQSCIEELRNTTQEEFDKRVSELQLKEKYYDKDYPEFEAIPLKIQTTSTWYKYPELKPENESTYLVCWQWNDYLDKEDYAPFVSFTSWNKESEKWEVPDLDSVDFPCLTEFENERKVLFWTEIQYPIQRCG